MNEKQNSVEEEVFIQIGFELASNIFLNDHWWTQSQYFQPWFFPRKNILFFEQSLFLSFEKFDASNKMKQKIIYEQIIT